MNKFKNLPLKVKIPVTIGIVSLVAFAPVSLLLMISLPLDALKGWLLLLFCLVGVTLITLAAWALIRPIFKDLDTMADFARNIGEGRLNVEYTALSTHVLGNSLLEMRGKLRIVEEELRNNIEEMGTMQQALAIEKERLQSLSDNFPDGCLYRFVNDLDIGKMCMEFVGANWEMLTGVAPELVAKDIKFAFANIHPDDVQPFLDAITEDMKIQTHFKHEIRFIRDDKIRWLQFNSCPYRKDNKIISDGVVMDITNRKEAECELQSSMEELQTTLEELSHMHNEVKQTNDKLSLVMDAANVALWEMKMTNINPVHPDNTFVWSKEARNMLGYTDENDFPDILNRWWDNLHPDDKERTMDAFSRHIFDRTGKTPYDVKFRMRKKNGEYAYFNVFGETSRDENGNALRVAGAIKDITEIKVAEHALAVEKERLQTLSDNLPDGCLYYFVINTVTERMYMEYVGAKWEAVTGVPPELVYDDIRSGFGNIPPEDQQSLLEAIHRDVKHNKNFQHEIRMIVDGVTRWLQFNSRSYEKNNKIISYGMVLNITIRKEAERELLLEKNRLQSLGDNLPGGVIYQMMDYSMGTAWFTYLSAQFIDLFEIEVETVISNPTPFYQCIHPDDFKHMQKIHNTVDEKTSIDFEFRIHTPSGKHKWIQMCASHHFVEGGKRVWEGFMLDVTARKMAEEATQQSEQMYRQLMVASPDSIINIDHRGSFLCFSPKTYELFGVDKEADISKLRIMHFIHPHDRRYALQILEELKRVDVYFVPQILLLRSDGTEFFGEISYATVNNSKGETTSFLMVVRDITRRKLEETELVQAKKKAEEADILKSLFLANMSHEIRSPMNGIIGFLSFINRQDLPVDKFQKYIGIIDSNSKRLLKLIDDILDISKLEAGQLKITKTNCPLNEIMQELEVLYNETCTKNKLSFIYDESASIDGLMVHTDPMRLRQVLTNLIGNAVKFTEYGYIRFGYLMLENEIQFFVEDTGIGMTEQQLAIVFERFCQADESIVSKYGGTGLGLAISKNLIELMGGKMWVTSQPNVGTTFFFTMPV